MLLEWRKPGVHIVPIGIVLFGEQTRPAIVGQDLGDGHEFDARVDFHREALLGMRKPATTVIRSVNRGYRSQTPH